MRTYDFAVIGAGIAGAAIAARLASQASVMLLETEAHPGYHATGRSAALYTVLYGNAVVRSLSAASRAFFDRPPAGFAEHALLTPRGRLYVGSATQQTIIEEICSSPLARPLDSQEARTLVPALRPEVCAHAALDTSAHDIDVHGLHQGYLRSAKSSGATVVCGAEVLSLQRCAGWQLQTMAGAFQARVLINAAGAWADTLAAMAGISSPGIRPLRRTAVLIDSPDAAASAEWPAVVAADASFYFKPDAGLILASPCDETPTPPCDAQPEEIDIAIAVDRIEKATTLGIRRVPRSWAGLRSFAADRSPVVGYDPSGNDFFWLAGLGGYGVQTAPALSQLAAALALRQGPPASLLASGIDTAALCPGRFASAAPDLSARLF